MPTKNDYGLITLTSDEVLDFALDALLKEVELYINGRKCTVENIITFYPGRRIYYEGSV